MEDRGTDSDCPPTANALRSRRGFIYLPPPVGSSLPGWLVWCHSAIYGFGLAEAGEVWAGSLGPQAASISDASCQGLAIFGLAESISLSRLVRMKITNETQAILMVRKIEDFLVQSRCDYWGRGEILRDPRHKMQAFWPVGYKASVAMRLDPFHAFSLWMKNHKEV